jgi:hypothetical protein
MIDCGVSQHKTQVNTVCECLLTPTHTDQPAQNGYVRRGLVIAGCAVQDDRISIGLAVVPLEKGTSNTTPLLMSVDLDARAFIHSLRYV